MADWLRNQHQGNEEVMPAVRHLAALPPTYPVALALAFVAAGASARATGSGGGSAARWRTTALISSFSW